MILSMGYLKHHLNMEIRRFRREDKAPTYIVANHEAYIRLISDDSLTQTHIDSRGRCKISFMGVELIEHPEQETWVVVL